MKLFIFQVFFFVFLLLFSRISHTAFAINGCFCDESSSCYPDGCTRKTITADGTVNSDLCKTAGCGGAYNACYEAGGVETSEVGRYFCIQQPPCCKDMVEKNDPHACCWPERGFCHPYLTCSKIDNQQQCGWYWEYHDGASNSQQGYGCARGTAGNLQPIFGLPAGVPGGQATATQTPTHAPTTIPTTRPTIIPTEIPIQTNNFPTNPPIINPTNIPAAELDFPTSNNSTSPVDFPSPITIGISHIRILVDDSVTNIKVLALDTIVASEKTLDLPNSLGKNILSRDQQLELFINDLFRQIIRFRL
jgi:hypothetical protein